MVPLPTPPRTAAAQGSDREEPERKLQALSRKLLEDGTVEVMIGYGDGSLGGTRPVFVTDPQETDQLRWNRSCHNNLAVYLNRPEIRRLGRPAVVVKGCDSRAVVTLVQEHQLQRDDVTIVGMACDGVTGADGALLPKCLSCRVTTPVSADHVIGEVKPLSGQKAPGAAVLAWLDGLSTEERRAFWQQELERCIKCYACRAVCPLCYCPSCFVDKTRPAWTSHSQTPHANPPGGVGGVRGGGGGSVRGGRLVNWVFHLFRAFHLAGRCIGCGECSRVCPQQIPLGLLNMAMAQEIHERYGYAPGLDSEATPPLLTFDTDDREDFFR